MKITGDQLGGLIRQTGDTLEQQEDGTWVGTVRYQCRWTNALYRAPRRNSARHPDFPALLCNGCQISRLKPGLVAELRATYKGLFGPEDPPDDELGNSTEEVLISTSEAPIETHPDFVELIAGTKAAPLNKAIFDDASKFLGFGSGSAFAGVESFLIPTTTYRKSTPSRFRPSSLADVGTIRNAPIAAPLGGNWLFTGRTWSRDGGVYQVVEEYLASGPKGWDPIVYPG